MALTLVVEDGTSKTNSNTYISLADAETYFESRLNVTNWSGATEANKKAALVQAGRVLNQYVLWLGWLTSEDQAMQWPRWGICYDGVRYYDCEDWFLTVDGVYSVQSDEIPNGITDAQCELALALLGDDTQSLPGTAGFKSIGVAGTIDLVIDKNDRNKVIPDHVWDIVSQYGYRKKTHVKMIRR